MTIGDATLLGILQGVTEFLPISSSGHLVVAQDLMGVSEPGILFEVVVHLGSLVSILVVFNHDIRRLLINWSTNESRSLFAYIAMGTVPVVVVGSIFRSHLEMAFENIQAVGIAFLATGTILILTAFVRVGDRRIDGKRSILIGLSQAMALLPGISRSGITISTGLMSGMDPHESARFSFFLAIPALFASGVLMSRDLVFLRPDMESVMVLVVGFATSVAVGIISLNLLLRILVRGRFHWFGVYCLAMGFLTVGM